MAEEFPRTPSPTERIGSGDIFNYEEFDRNIVIHNNIFEELNKEIEIGKLVIDLYFNLIVFYLKYKLIENDIIELNNDIDRFNSGDESIFIEINNKLEKLSELIKSYNPFFLNYNKIISIITTSKQPDYEKKILEIIKNINFAKQYILILNIIILSDKNLKYENFIEYFEKYDKIYEFGKRSVLRFKIGEILNLNNHIITIKTILTKLDTSIIELDSRLLFNDIFTNFYFWFDLYEQTIKLVKDCVIKGNQILYYNNDNDKMIMTVKPIINDTIKITEHLLIFRFPTVYLKRKYLGLKLKPIAYKLHKYALIKFNSDFMVSQPIKSIDPVFKIFIEKGELIELNIDDLPVDKSLFCLEPTKLYRVNKDKLMDQGVSVLASSEYYKYLKYKKKYLALKLLKIKSNKR